MPAWNNKTQEWVREGKLVVLGIAQEQHPNRNRLFAQWHKIDWPILHDPINVMQVRGVPIEVAIDENGIVRSLRPKMDKFEEEFLNKTFISKGLKPYKNKTIKSDLGALLRRAEKGRSSEAWRELGDALVLWGGKSKTNDAINAYKQALQINPDDGDAHFRLGVCYRLRYDSGQRASSDFQMAVNHWTMARAIQPNQYIWRRRIEQYGPRLTKPYPFYDWVETAAREIKARAEKPVELMVLPTGSEIADKGSKFETKAINAKPPDPQGQIYRDKKDLVLSEVTIVPPQVKPGETVRVHVTLSPNAKLKAHWNNEAKPLKFWIEATGGWKVEPQLLTAPQGSKPETSEPRQLEFEVRVPDEASGTSKLNAYALYYVCEDTGGVCYFLRKDIPIIIKVDKK
ncbi:MAG: tetratricopeptide repeat protein [Planctomycetes bacterium]|nr:tetratricopeptide repeat protein [Planctomycetota bacterium]